MPSVSDAQEKFMRIAAHDPKFARKTGISQSVAKEFYEADQAQKHKSPPKKPKRKGKKQR